MASPPTIASALPTLAPELVRDRPRRRVAGHAHGDLVPAGLDRHVLRDRRLAALAPRLELVLAGRQVLEREPARLVGHDVRRRRDDRDVRAHVCMQVATEPDDALALEGVFARLADLVEPEVEGAD